MLFYAESSPSGMMISKDFVFSSKSCVGMLLAHKEIRSIFFPLPYEDSSRAVIGVK